MPSISLVQRPRLRYLLLHPVASDPSVRAFLPQTLLRVLEKRSADDRRRVLARVATKTLDEVHGATRLEWLPFAPHRELLDACRAELGDAVLEDMLHDLAMDGMSSPILKGFLETGLRMFGVTPIGMLRWAHRAWPLLVKNLGEASPEIESDHRATYHLLDLPSASVDCASFVVGFTGSLRAYLTMTRARGSVRMVEFRPEQGRATYAMEWE